MINPSTTPPTIPLFICSQVYTRLGPPYFLVPPVGIEPTSAAPQAAVLSIERRERPTHTKIKTLFSKGFLLEPEDLGKMLAELKRQGFKGVFSVEYEHNTPELVDNVRKCAEFFNKCATMTQKELEALPDK